MPGARAFALHLGRDGLGIGDIFDDAFFAVIAPGVERAFQQIAMYLAAMAHMRAKMFAISINHPDLPVLAAPNGKIGREIAQRFHFADSQIFG